MRRISRCIMTSNQPRPGDRVCIYTLRSARVPTDVGPNGSCSGFSITAQFVSRCVDHMWTRIRRMWRVQ